MATTDTPDPNEPQGVASQPSVSDEIGADELAALLGQTPAKPAPVATAPPPVASETFGDEIGADELAALLGKDAAKPASPRVAPPPAAPIAATPAPPAPQTAAKPKATTNAFNPVKPLAETVAMDASMSLLMDVPLCVSVELGRISMTLQQVLELGRGSIIELERLAGEPVDILVNDKLIGHGEVVVVDEYFGVKITELIEPKG